MAAGDNPNRVSRLNKNPFVLRTSFDPSDVFAHPPRGAHSPKLAYAMSYLRFIIAFLAASYALHL